VNAIVIASCCVSVFSGSSCTPVPPTQVCVVAAATFVLVACYYFRCLKLMVGYLIFASVNLLGYTGSFMVISAIQAYQAVRICGSDAIADWPLNIAERCNDQIFDYGTLVFIMLNFAVGVVAVFWQKGVPRFITQSYLIAVSVSKYELSHPFMVPDLLSFCVAYSCQ